MVWVRLEHECVLPLYGISFDFGKCPAMVCPWLEGGTISKYLDHHEGLQLHTRLQLVSESFLLCAVIVGLTGGL